MAKPCVRCGGEGSITCNQYRGSGSMTQPGLFGPKWPTIIGLMNLNFDALGFPPVKIKPTVFVSQVMVT